MARTRKLRRLLSTNRDTNRRLAGVAVAMAILSWVGTAVGEEIESKAWDQQLVTGIAKDLAESLSEVEDAFRKELGNMMPTGDRRSRYAAKQDLRRLRREARHLARELESGMGLEETLNIFLKVQEFAHDAARNGKRAALTKPTLDYANRSVTCRFAFWAWPHLPI